jgi:hypothetical protein
MEFEVPISAKLWFPVVRAKDPVRFALIAAIPTTEAE